MSKVIKILALVTLFSIPVFSNAQLTELVDEMPNIIVGQVYYVGDYSFTVSADWELKGQLQTTAHEVVFENGLLESENIRVGDKVVILIDRGCTKPLDKLPKNLFNVSRFNELNGQCAYRALKTMEDNALVSDVYSQVSENNLAAAFSF